MWTVTLLLKPLIVVLHLLGGLATLSLLAWLAMRSCASDRAPSAPVERTRPARAAGCDRSLAGLVVLVLQIALGGWTSSNYAALACPDFPTCQNVAWPRHGREGRFRAVARARHRLRRRRARPSGARRDSFRAPARGADRPRSCWDCSASWPGARGRNAAIRIAGVVLGVVLLAQLILGPLMVVRALPLSAGDGAQRRRRAAAARDPALNRLLRSRHLGQL